MSEVKRYQLKKILSNNALLAVDASQTEVILLGKGIGFQRKKGDWIGLEQVEKLFLSPSDQNRDAMLRLFAETDEDVIRATSDFIQYAENKLQLKFTQQFLITLFDHIGFAIKRLQQGIQIRNPFLHEVRALYPKEYSLALEGIKMLANRLKIKIPEDEVGFIALHLHGAGTHQTIEKINKYSTLIAKLIAIIESELLTEIDKTTADYSRLLTHLRFAVDRAEKDQPLGENHPLSTLLQKEYPVCYNLSWKLIKILQKELQKKIPEAEASYLTLHIQRLYDHTNIKNKS
ncbi:PRD domain-containing protein [Fodinisporobacter ferrooxydans]|uniref:PRD domain-containing protein n=1 Tax=Fodinisporobacter ferrooxydans TaxID=2901836 RepID=A0ABY4CGG8_9BACL|nr:PRD domain-containing protein [Alicyclobacillaceae bacterium MYW30-H2]